MTNRTTAILLFILLSLGVAAQSVRDEIAANPCLSASNYLAYIEPRKPLTPAPAGYEPYYISDYCRHGSRYLTNKRDYDYVVRVLQHADSAGVLTAKGRDLLAKTRLMRDDADGRAGELTQLGTEQHRRIAERMYTRFPEVFAGAADIDARSTVVIRCILSMENQLQQLLRHNTKLQIRHDASQHDMYYMNLTDKALNNQKENAETRKLFADWQNAHVDCKPFLARIFSSTAYSADSIDGMELTSKVFSLAGILQDTELRKQFSLYGFFTTDELYNLWSLSNLWWYLHYGPSPQNGGRQPFSQRNLLRNIIATADTCLRLRHPGATMRFGHETMVMPLACLMELNTFGQPVADVSKLEASGWVNYRLFPMAANIQLVFYKNVDNPYAGGKLNDDILVKVLLNEEEATLPLKPVTGPYYRWSDVRRYYLQKLDSYK